MAKLTLVIIIPSYNEEKSIYKIIKNIPLISDLNQKVIVIDDGSTDRTFFEAKKAGAKVISNKINSGLGYSFKLGLIEALKNNAEIIVNLDADYQYDPRKIPQLIAYLLENNLDLVVGNRLVNEMPYEEKRIIKLGNKLLSILISKIILKLNEVIDTQSSFRAFNKKIAYFLAKMLSNRYNYAQEMIILANLYKFKIKQVPVKCSKRIFGKSRLKKSNFLHFLKVVWISLKTFYIHRNLKRKSLNCE